MWCQMSKKQVSALPLFLSKYVMKYVINSYLTDRKQSSYHVLI